MAIFGAIPMPQNSGDILSGHVNNMIKQLMDRQHQAQQQGQYNRTLAQQQQQHKDAMGFQQQTQNRLNQMMPLQIQALNDAHEKMQFETNPAKRMEYMQKIVQGIKSMRQNQGGGAQMQDQQMPMEQPNFPMFQGGGMPGMQQPQQPMNQGGQQQVAPPSMEQLQQGFGGLTPDEIQAAEMAGIKFPKPYETPQMKQDRELETYRKKQEIKGGASGDNVPLTGAIKTKLQGVVTGVDNSLPVIKDLINDFKNLPTGMEFYNPAAYAAYNAKANAIIEPLINAFGLNVTDATKDMMHEQVFRKTNEPLDKYRNRLVDLAKEIIRRRDDSFKSLKSGSINPKSEFTSDAFENLKNETKVINGKTYTKINGEWHE